MCQELEVHALQTGCPAALLRGVTDHERRNAKPATDFLNTERAAFQHLGVFGIHGDALVLQSAFKHHDFPGVF